MPIKSVIGNNASKPPHLNQLNDPGELAKGMASHFSNVGCKIKNSIEVYPEDGTFKQFLGPLM